MRRAAGVVLIGVGLFSVVFAILLPTVVVSKSKKTPLDLDVTQISSGRARLLDAETGQLKDVTLRATRVVKTDTSASDDKYTTVFETLCIVVVQGPTPNCVSKDDPRLLSASTDRVTGDRVSGESVHVPKYAEAINGDTSARHTGLSYKWPIDAKKKTYMFFQPDIGKAFPATYEGTDRIRGLTVYKYVCRTGVQTTMGNGKPYLVNGLFPGTYEDDRTVWVEPRTGVIVYGEEHQVLHITSETDPEGQLALDTVLKFEKSAVDYQSNYAKDRIDDLKLAQVWGPLVFAILALVSFVGAYFLLRSRAPGDGGQPRRRGRHSGPTPDDDPNRAEPPLWAGRSSS